MDASGYVVRPVLLGASGVALSGVDCEPPCDGVQMAAASRAPDWGEVPVDQVEALDCLDFAEGVPWGKEIDELEPRQAQLQEALEWLSHNGQGVEALRLATAL